MKETELTRTKIKYKRKKTLTDSEESENPQERHYISKDE
jgi:hypothetical protein